MIYIAKNYEGLIISIVNAKNRDLANAYWQGANIIPHSVSSLEEDYTPIEEHLTGVYEVLKTSEVEIYHKGKFHKLVKVIQR